MINLNSVIYDRLNILKEKIVTHPHKYSHYNRIYLDLKSYVRISLILGEPIWGRNASLRKNTYF